jgi:hypothetical protein
MYEKDEDEGNVGFQFKMAKECSNSYDMSICDKCGNKSTDGEITFCHTDKGFVYQSICRVCRGCDD